MVKNKGFNYNNKSSARYFFVVEKKKEILYSGPFIEDRENCINFKRQHKTVYEEKNRLYAREKIDFNIKEFIERWRVKNTNIIKEMYINSLTYI
jgi:hypothetical protein